MSTLRTDDKAQGRMARLGIGIIVALAVIALVGGVLVPIGVSNVEEDRDYTITSDTGEVVNVTSLLNAEVTATTAGTDATVQLNDSTGDSETNTVAVGSETTYNLNDGSVDVNVTAAESGNATVRYEVEQGFGYSSGADAIWSNLGLVIVLGVFLFIIGAALLGRRQFT